MLPPDAGNEFGKDDGKDIVFVLTINLLDVPEQWTSEFAIRRRQNDEFYTEI